MDRNGISSIIRCATTKVWLKNLPTFVRTRSALGYFALNMIGHSPEWTKRFRPVAL
jgi:hypothetical protein